MQIATLNYQYGPKDKYSSDSKSKAQHRHILTTFTSPQKKSKQQRTFQPDVSLMSSNSLPPIQKSGKRPNSIRVNGSGLQSSKANDKFQSSLRQPSRTRSRHSNRSDLQRTRSQSITPSGNEKDKPKSVRLKFGYPVTIRSADFYESDPSNTELRLREEAFVNDSIRIAHQTIRPGKAPHYEPFDDPNLKYFFQSPVVLDVVRRTLDIDLDARPSNSKKRSRRKNSSDAYHGIVAKHSSGYGKLNGYDCLPPFATSRHPRSLSHDRHHSSANTSFASVPTYNSLSSQQKKLRSHSNKSKHLTPLSGSSPIRHPTVVNGDTAGISNISQD